MRYFTKDHPRCRSPQGCMSCDEIRFWIRSLPKDHGWRVMALTRFLGFHDRGAMMSKLRKSWIYPGEQIRVSKQLLRIISGEVVCQLVSKVRYEACITQHRRVPLRQPIRLKFDLTTGRVRYTADLKPARDRGLPSFTALGG